MSMNVKKRYKSYQSRRALLLASSFFISSGLVLLDEHGQIKGQADQIELAAEVSTAATGTDPSINLPAALNQTDTILAMADDQDPEEQKKKTLKKQGQNKVGHTKQNDDKVEPLNPGFSPTTGSPAVQLAAEKTDSAAGANQLTTTEKIENENPADQINQPPLTSLYEQTTQAYEKLLVALGSHEANNGGGGDATLTSDQRHIDQAGIMIFGEPDKPWLGLTGFKNDYANISQMRLTVDDSLTKKVTEKIKAIVGEQTTDSVASYFPKQNVLVLAGGMPLTANVYSSNDGILSPQRYYKMLEATLSSAANVLSIGLIEDKLSHNYKEGDYGVYVRIEVPEGVNPNDFVQTLNLDYARFASEMNFNATLGLDRLANLVPGLNQILSTGLGVPVSGNVGSVIDAVLGQTIKQLNEKYGTSLSVKNSDSPFYPITIYPKATKVGNQEDPSAIYLLVRGDQLKNYSGAVVQAKMMLTKFFMETLSWAGNITGGAYGYLNFDLNRYPGNMSTQEMHQYYHGEGTKSKQTLAKHLAYADNSPYKILTRHQLPPTKSGQLSLGLNILDADTMLSRDSHDYGKTGDLGSDIAIKHGSEAAHPLPMAAIKTWRAYISPFDQQQELNTKTVANHSEEWDETQHQDTVLPGTDLDHRVITLANGQNFYDQLTRFDRVIDYFDHQVLLDENGFHPNQTVKAVRLVRSVDPAGQQTSRKDFAIYNRPFTVYYHGEMTMDNGEVIALRPTQLTVLQKNDSLKTDLDQARAVSLQTVQKQGDYLKNLIMHLQPKLLDRVVEEYAQKIEMVISQMNQQLNVTQTPAAVSTLQKNKLDQFLSLQSQASQQHQLAPAIINANRDMAYNEIDQVALASQVGINNASELTTEQQQTFVDQVHLLSQKGKQGVGQARDVDAIRQSLDQTISKTQAVFVGRSGREQAKRALEKAGAKKKDQFAMIAHVDRDSLHYQQEEVNRLVTSYQQRIDQTRGSLKVRRLVEEGLGAIDQVTPPVTEDIFSAASPADIAAAKLAITNKGQAKIEVFHKMAHTDPKSLAKQIQLVQAVIDNACHKADDADTKGNLSSIVGISSINIDNIAAPEIIYDYQPVNELRSRLALNNVDWQGRFRREGFEQIAHVDPVSLKQQCDLLNQIMEQGKAAIMAAKINLELIKAEEEAIDKISAVSKPTLLTEYQPLKGDQLDQAILLLQQLGDKQKTKFSQLPGVEQTSLAKQQQAIDLAVRDGKAALSKANNQHELQQYFQEACRKVKGIPSPEIIEALQPASAEDKDRAVDYLRRTAQTRQNVFKVRPHTDQDSLNQQLAILDQVLQQGLDKINQAQTKGELGKVVDAQVPAINAVAFPKLEFAYQAIQLADVLSAYQKLADRIKVIGEQFKKIDHVDPLSLVKQSNLLQAALESGRIAMNQSLIQKDLQAAYDHGVALALQVARPQILPDYQPVDRNDQGLARQTLKDTCREQQDQFEKIDHVDLVSLKEQKAALVNALKIGLQGIDQVKTKGELKRALAAGLNDLHQVSAPVISKDYQPVSDLDRDLSQQILKHAGQVKKAALAAVKHADQVSLLRQENLVDQVLTQSQQAIQQAQIQLKLKGAVQDGLARIAQVAKPTLILDYQPITENDQVQALANLNQGVQDKKATFKAIDHVDPDSLSRQVQLVENQGVAGQAAIQAAHSKKDLNQVLVDFLDKIAQVADPVKLLAYQLVDPSDQIEGNRRLRAAGENKKNVFDALVGVDQSQLAEQKKLVDQAVSVASQAVEQAQTNQDLLVAFKAGIQAIEAVSAPIVRDELVPASPADKKAAQATLTKMIDECKKVFHQIDHVDPDSLQQQLQALDQVGAIEQIKLDQADTKGDLNHALVRARQSLATVSKPTLAADFRPVTDADRYQANQVLSKTVTVKKNEFTAIVNVDPLSLNQQQAALDQALQTANDELSQAKTKQELTKALADGLAAINQIASPQIKDEWQAISPADQQQARSVLETAFAKKQAGFKEIAHVDRQSLQEQQRQLKVLYQKALEKINGAENQATLQTAVQEGVTALNQVLDPVLQVDYQPVALAIKDSIYRLVIKLGQDKRQRFSEMKHVDPVSLRQRQGQIDDLLQQAQTDLVSVKVNKDLTNYQDFFLTGMDAIANPTLLLAYQLVGANDRDTAKKVVVRVAQDKRQKFAAIDHVNGESLKMQLNQLDNILHAGLQEIEIIQVNHKLQEAISRIKSNLNAVATPNLEPTYQPATAASRLAGQQTLLTMAQARKDFFAGMTGTIPVSLSQQQEAIDQTVGQYITLIEHAHSTAEIQNWVQTGIREINQVAQPRQDWKKQVASPQEIVNAQQDIIQTGRNRIQDFGSLVGVDPEDLIRQETAVSGVVQNGLDKTMQVKLKGDLHRLVKTVKEELQKVGLPELQWLFRRPTLQDRQAADHKLHQAADQKKGVFEQIEGNDLDSLNQQKGIIDHLVTEAQQKMAEVVVNAGLSAILQETLHAIDQVDLPHQDRSHQPVSDDEINRAKGIVQSAADRLQKRFKLLNHVTSKSLKKQLALIDDIVTKAKEEIELSQTNADVDRARENALKQLGQVQEPLKMTVVDQNRMDAHHAIQGAADQKRTALDQDTNLNKKTYLDQLHQLKLLVTQAHLLIDQATTVQDILDQLKRSLQNIAGLGIAVDSDSVADQDLTPKIGGGDDDDSNTGQASSPTPGESSDPGQAPADSAKIGDGADMVADQDLTPKIGGGDDDDSNTGQASSPTPGESSGPGQAPADSAKAGDKVDLVADQDLTPKIGGDDDDDSNTGQVPGPTPGESSDPGQAPVDSAKIGDEADIVADQDLSAANSSTTGFSIVPQAASLSAIADDRVKVNSDEAMTSFSDQTLANSVLSQLPKTSQGKEGSKVGLPGLILTVWLLLASLLGFKSKNQE